MTLSDLRDNVLQSVEGCYDAQLKAAVELNTVNISSPYELTIGLCDTLDRDIRIDTCDVSILRINLNAVGLQVSDIQGFMKEITKIS